MRRKAISVISAILCSLVLCGSAVLFIGCAGEEPNPYADFVPSQMPEEVVDDYLQVYIDKYGYGNGNLNISDEIIDGFLYYGEYNGAHIIYPYRLMAVLFMAKDDVAEGFVFHFPDSMFLDVFYVDKVYRLQEAYDAGILSYDDLHTIYLKYTAWQLNMRKAKHEGDKDV